MTLGENIISKVLGGEGQWCCHSLRGYVCACSERVTGTPRVASHLETEFCQESLDSVSPPVPNPPHLPPVGTAVGSCSHLPGISKQMALGFWDSSSFKCSF